MPAMHRALPVIRSFSLSLLLAASPVFAGEAPPPSPDAAAFLAEIDSLRKAARIPGLAVAVVKDQSILLAAGLGYADLDARIPTTAETPFNIASVTKPISAVAALKLVEAGKLDLDRPIAEYSEWSDFCARFSQ